MTFSVNRLLLLVSVIVVCGCKLPGLSESSSSSTQRPIDNLLIREDPSANETNSEVPKVQNPPAKTIRFEGRETVLGTAKGAQMSTGTFCTNLGFLLEQQKYFTASSLVMKHPDVAEQAFWERYAIAADDQLVEFIAEVLSRNVPPTVSFNSLRSVVKSDDSAAQTYHQSRSRFVTQLKLEDPSQQDAEQLRINAQRLNHPLVMLDALRLLALRELVNGRHAWAESLFLQAANLALQHQDKARESEFWLMAATTANRSERLSDAREAWRKATNLRLEWCLVSNHPLSPSFWIRADEQRPSSVEWPEQTSRALLSHVSDLGCNFSAQSPSEMVLWCAVASAQYENSQHQAALLNFKRAESLATGDDVMWLRIAQSKCLASLGQSQAAATLLSGPAASKNPRIAIAATASIGSAKLQAGTFQQGLLLINKALEDPRVTNWPGRSRAEADRVLGMLILGETDPGLESMHAIQQTFEQQNERLALLQSLENELHLLEHEGRDAESENVREKIRRIELDGRMPQPINI
jgi:hypothetical protein